MRELLCLHVGQAGAQIGSACWQMLANEHKINEEGTCTSDAEENNNDTMFQQTSSGRFVPRCIMIDLQPMAIDEIKKGKYGKLFNQNGFITGKQSAASNFIRAYYTIGKQLLEPTLDLIRKRIENCDSLQGIMMYNSIEGGTGSGMTASILSRLSIEYPKTIKMNHVVAPSPRICTNMVSPYNTTLFFHDSLSYSDLVLLYDNEALYKIAQDHQQIENPSYGNINQLISQMSSNITASYRFPKNNTISATLRQLCTNLIPYPRTKFMTASCSTFNGLENQFQKPKPVLQSTQQLFNNSTNYLSITSSSTGVSMGSALFYRGNTSHREINQAINKIKLDKNIYNNIFDSTGFKLILNNLIPSYDYSLSSNFTRPLTCSMLSNNSKVSQLFKRTNGKFDKLYFYRGFVHWFVGEGLDQGFFSQSRQDLAALQRDYQQMDHQPYVQLQQ